MPVKLARPIPNDITFHPFEGAASGINKLYMKNGHLVKESTYPHTEQIVSRAFRATKTPGAVKTGVGYLDGKPYSVSNYLGKEGVQKLTWANPKPEDLHNHAGNILFSELASRVADRHAGNYLVSPQGIHSIDHEFSLHPDLGKEQLVRPHVSGLYQSYLSTHGTAPTASADHLARWESYAPKMLESVDKNPELTPDQKTDFRSHLTGFLSQARQLAQQHGHVPLGGLVPQHWNPQAAKLSKSPDDMYPPLSKYIDPNGDVTLHHFSRELPDDTVTLDPAKVGKHKYTMNDMKVSRAPRLFFYTDPNEREPIVGGKHYVTKVRGSDIYDLRADPANLVTADLGRTLAKVAELGHKGVYYNTGGMGVVNWFHPVTASPVAKLTKWEGNRAYFDTGDGENEYKARWTTAQPQKSVSEPVSVFDKLRNTMPFPLHEYAFEHQMPELSGDEELGGHDVLGVGHAKEAIRKSGELLLASLRDRKPQMVMYSSNHPSRRKLYDALTSRIEQYNPSYTGYRIGDSYHAVVHKDHEDQFTAAAQKAGVPVTRLSKLPSDPVALAREPEERHFTTTKGKPSYKIGLHDLPPDLIENFHRTILHGGKDMPQLLDHWIKAAPEHYPFIEPIKVARTYPENKDIKGLDGKSRFPEPLSIGHRYFEMGTVGDNMGMHVTLGSSRKGEPVVGTHFYSLDRTGLGLPTGAVHTYHKVPALLWHAMAEKLGMSPEFRDYAKAKWPKYSDKANLNRGLGQAVPGMTGRQENVRLSLAKRVLREAGVQGQVIPALHIAEDSRPSVLQTLVHPGEPEAVPYLAAWYGLLAKEPRLTVFHEGQGDDKLHILTTGAKPAEIQSALKAHGIQSGVSAGGRLHIFDPAGSLSPFVTQLASNLHAQHSIVSGVGSSIGSSNSRTDSNSRQSYRTIIDRFSSGSTPATSTGSANTNKAAA